MKDDSGSIRETFVRYCRKVYEKGLSAGTSGNISTCADGRVIITPSGFCLGDVEVDDVVVMDEVGNRLEGRNEASSGWLIHQRLYQVRTDIQAIIHAHPPKATGMAAAHHTIDQPLIAESVYHLGETIPLVPYVLPGTEALAQMIAEYALTAQVMILANHGVITLGRTLQEAYAHLELLESLAEMYIVGQSLPGGLKPLSRCDVDEILALKQRQMARTL